MLQDKYIKQLVTFINNKSNECFKVVNFTSPTGTGKTKMMSKLINMLHDCYFIVTTISKGQLHIQIRNNLNKDCLYRNFIVYGSADYRINSRLQADDIIGNIPNGVKCIWLRDEGHIRTNKFEELLINKCYKVINFSATNMHSDIRCNFTQTMMLRTVNQTVGTPEDAIKKLMQIKYAHHKVINYNPCAIFRCVSGNNEIYNRIINACVKNKLKYIDITNEDFDMSELCKDDNEYDVIINKFKIVEGIDIRRAHVLYMDNYPNNNATIIQVIGRCRRNALLYRDDIDILADDNNKLLEKTRECYVYYNVEAMNIDTDQFGELQYAFCNYISCEELNVGFTIEVVNGQLHNGLTVLELKNKTGKFKVEQDKNTGFNIVVPVDDFYKVVEEKHEGYEYVKVNNEYKKIKLDKIKAYPLKKYRSIYSYAIGDDIRIECEPYYDISELPYNEVKLNVTEDAISDFKDLSKDIKNSINNMFSGRQLDLIIDEINAFQDEFGVDEDDIYYFYEVIEKYKEHCDISDYKLLDNINKYIFMYNNNKYKIEDILDYGEIALLSFCCINMLNSIDFKDIYEVIDDIMITICEIKSCGEDIINIDNSKLIGFIYCFIVKHNRVVCNMQHIENVLKFWCNDNKTEINSIYIYTYFCKLLELLDNKDTYIINLCSFNKLLEKYLGNILHNLERGFRSKETHSYLEDVNEDELYALKNKYIKCNDVITEKEYSKLRVYQKYIKIKNDAESAIVGTDKMRQIRSDDGTIVWCESKAVSSKVNNFNKLNIFISNKYSTEIELAKQQCFTGKNDFKLDRTCNKVLGYCVEYYSKWILYGDAYLGYFIKRAQEESHTKAKNDFIIIRACMLKYKDMMIRSYGRMVAKVIKGISIEALIQKDYKYFVELVVKLGNRTANFVKSVLYKDTQIIDDIDPNLSLEHIGGLADYITRDTILDIKVRNHIDIVAVKQVLGYHYLSTKRSDLHIKRVIVYDAVSDKCVSIDISKENINL